MQAAHATTSSYRVSPGSLSLGRVDISVPVWSTIQGIAIRNLSATPQTINLSVAAGLPAGLTASISPASITIPGGRVGPGYVRVWSVDNAVLPFPTNDPLAYAGRLLLTNGSEQTHVPFALIKAAQLIVNWDVTPDIVYLHNRAPNGKFVMLGQPTSPQFFLLPPGTYDIITWYIGDNQMIVDENILLATTTTYDIFKADANYSFTPQAYEPSGAEIAGKGISRKVGIIHIAGNQGFYASMMGSTETSMSGLMSGMSAAYHYETAARHQDSSDTFHNLVYGVNGVSGPLSPINNYTDATRLVLEYEGLPGSLRPIYAIGRYGNAVEDLGAHPILPSLSQQVYYLTPFAADAIFNSRAINVGDDALTQYYLYGNLLTSIASGTRSMQIRNYSPLSGYQYGLASYADDLWVLDGSPHYWSSHSENDTTQSGCARMIPINSTGSISMCAVSGKIR